MSGLLHGWTGILMGYAAVQATVLPSQVEQLRAAALVGLES